MGLESSVARVHSMHRMVVLHSLHLRLRTPALEGEKVIVVTDVHCEVDIHPLVAALQALAWFLVQDEVCCPSGEVADQEVGDRHARVVGVDMGDAH